MILVDTSVWIAHFRQGVPSLQKLLLDGEVLGHPFVVGEVSCGHLRNRLEILNLLRSLPQARVADENEVMHLVHHRRLMGRGIGWIDAHLLASAVLTHVPLWTFDKALSSAAKDLHLTFHPS
jgi:predicted nucleic acid-binding protein